MKNGYLKFTQTGNGLSSNTHETGSLFLVFLFLMLAKYAYFGFKYYPIMDDFIQFGYYPKLPDIFNDVFAGGAKTIYARPLATVFDVFVWGSTWPNLGISLFIITVLHAFSGIFLYKIFYKINITLSPVFLLIYGFLPLGTEGTYWISASGRIVVPLFFMSIAIYSFCKYYGEKKPIYLFFFLTFNLISYCFYEQIIVLSFFLTLFVIIRLKKSKFMIIPLINLFIIFLYYIIFAPMGGDERLSPTDLNNFLEHIQTVLYGIFESWGSPHVAIYINGFRRGLELLFFRGAASLVWFFMILYSIWVWFKSSKNNFLKYDLQYLREFVKICIGVFFFVSPYAPYLISNSTWVSFRNCVPSFLGLALIADGIFLMLFKWKQLLLPVITSAVLAVFMVVMLSEVHDYSRVGMIDVGIANRVAEEMREKGVVEYDYYGIHDLTTEQNSKFHEHILSITSCDWGISGAVRSVLINKKIKVYRK